MWSVSCTICYIVFFNLALLTLFLISHVYVNLHMYALTITTINGYKLVNLTIKCCCLSNKIINLSKQVIKNVTTSSFLLIKIIS